MLKKQAACILILLVISCSSVSARLLLKQPLSPRIVSYTISAKLDAARKVIDGHEVLRWRNTSNDRIGEMQFHLYLNAFKNNRSTFMKESGGQLRSIYIDKDEKDSWGYIDILSVKKDDGTDLTSKIRYIQPDDGNKEDQTVISLQLDRPLNPGEEIRLNISFRSKLPRIFARTGFSDNYFFAGQWFPKPGVYEYPGIRYAEKGMWNCHQFHANSEFYADFGVYDVSITLPSDYIVGAVGELQNIRKNHDGTSTHNYRAEDVVDFAWTASERFIPVEDKWQDVKIIVLLQPEHFAQAGRHIISAKQALSYFDRHLGKYPYTTITIVDPPINAMGSAGMEYPSLITAGTIWGLPGGVRFLEQVTIHEFGHNYFMGLLASNEFEEAFLDEGFNQYYETRIMDYAYGSKSSFIDLWGFRAGDFEVSRNMYTGMSNPKIAEIARPAWGYTAGGYGQLSYGKTAVVLKTLEGLVGIKTMDEIMKTYYDRWKFRHPALKDFISIANEIIIKNHGTAFGTDMNWFFSQTFYGSDVCDYKLSSIKNNKITRLIGYSEGKNGRQFTGRGKEDIPEYESVVTAARIGEIKLPVEVLIHFENGREIKEKWDGQGRTKEFRYTGKSKVLWAKIDPADRIPLDINLVNNSMTTEPEGGVFAKYAAKLLFWLENVMLSLSILF